MNHSGRILLRSAPFALLLAAGACGQKNGSDSDVMAVTDGSFQKEVISSDQPVLVDFWATWCGPCRMYGPIVDKVAKDYKGRLKVVRVDVDQNPELSKFFKIQAIPDSILINKGNVLKTWVGYIPETELRSGLEQSLPPVSSAASTHS